jgi:flagellar motor switch protein FliG
MNGVEKSAALMVALGADVAASIMKYLDEDTLSRISIEIAKVDRLEIEDKEDLIGEFILETKKLKGAVIGGENVASNILKAAFGEEKTKEIFKKLTRRDLEKGFDYLKNIDSKILAAMLENEHPQTITIALVHLAPEISAGVLKNISPSIGKEIIKRMAKIDKVSPEAVLEIARVIKKKYEKLKISSETYTRTDGVKTLVDIMSQMNATQEKKLMEYFEFTNAKIYNEIRENIFNFENIVNLTRQEMQILIDEINEDWIIVKALKGAEDEIKFKFLRNTSANRATDIINEFDRIGPIRLSEINEARSQIVDVMRRLNDNRIISVRKDKEQYVE